MMRLEKEFNEYCNSNIHTSQFELHCKVLARWAQKEITNLRTMIDTCEAEKMAEATMKANYRAEMERLREAIQYCAENEAQVYFHPGFQFPQRVEVLHHIGKKGEGSTFLEAIDDIRKKA